MFIVILFLLGLCFGYAARLPWALLAFLVPIALTFTASDLSGPKTAAGFIVTGVGILAGLILAAGTERQHA